MDSWLAAPPEQRDELWPLIDGLYNGTLTEEQRDRLDSLILHDDEVAAICAAFADMQAMLRWRFRPIQPDAVVESPAVPSPVLPSTKIGVPVSVTEHLWAASGFSLSGWPAAYLIATVICGIGAMIGAVVQVSQPDTAIEYASLPAHGNAEERAVGRITGMVDCTWGEGKVQGARFKVQDSVVLGQRIALHSGLLEITYKTGARVILQGPATYNVDSEDSGYLAIGRLTASLEKSAKHGVPGTAYGSANHGDSNPQSLIPNPSPFPSPLFTVTTPNAVVTDLGTEFGVHVSPNDGTRVCVMQGKVSLRPVKERQGSEAILEKGQSSRVDGRGALQSVSPDSQSQTKEFAKSFVRSLPERRRPDFVSLADLVAGGDGFGDRHFWGISPRDASLRLTLADHSAIEQVDGTAFSRYTGKPQINGVFVPDGSGGPVQIDSAGHTVTLPETSRYFCQYSIWAFKAKPWAMPSQKKPSAKKAKTLDPYLLVHANAGVTFDLAAIRASAEGRNATAFTTQVKNCKWTSADTFAADMWVFVDGRLVFSRQGLKDADGAIDVNVPLQPTDRFLTLVVTDGGDGITCDCVCLSAPRVRLETVKPKKPGN